MLGNQINISKNDTVIYGENCVADRLISTLDQYNLSKVFLVSTKSLVKNGQLEFIQSLLGEKLVGGFYQSVQHTPREIVFKAVDELKNLEADCIISLGGSSVVDLGKAIAIVQAEGRELDGKYVEYSPSEGLTVPSLPNPKLPHINIATTLSGSEFTIVTAITNDHKEKHLYLDPKTIPIVSFQDPILCEKTPDHLWAATGMKAYADCIESYTSPHANAYTRANAFGALEILHNELPKACGETKTHQSRANCLLATFMVTNAAMNTGLGLTAGCRHQLGSNFGLSHGVASTIMLPHVIRYNLSSSVALYAEIARKLGVSKSAEDKEAAKDLIGAIEALVETLNLPKSLGEFNIDKAAFKPIADHIVNDFAIVFNPKKVETADEILGLLEGAY